MLRNYVLAVAALLMWAPLALADNPPANPLANAIATVNIQLVMRDSTAAKNVREQLESKQKAFQADISKKQDKLQKEQQELGKQQSVLSKEAFAEKSRAFGSKVTEVQKEVQSKKALLDNAFERSIGSIQKVVTDILAEMSKEKGYIAVMPTSEILYGDPKLDITDEVIKRLNQKLPKVDVKFDTASEDKASKSKKDDE